MQLLPKETVVEWGLQNLPEEKQVEMVDRIGRFIYQAVLVRALDILSDKEQEEFDVLFEKDSTTPEDVLRFLASKIPTLEALVAEEREKLKDDILVPAKKQ